MKKWSYGINGLYRECYVFLTDEPWWVEPFTKTLTWLCEHTPRIPLPFMKYLKHVEEDGDTCNLAEYYGDDLRCLFCEFIHIPLANWAHNKEKTIHRFDIGWDKGKELFYHENPEMWDEEERDYGIENA